MSFLLAKFAWLGAQPGEPVVSVAAGRRSLSLAGRTDPRAAADHLQPRRDGPVHGRSGRRLDATGARRPLSTNAASERGGRHHRSRRQQPAKPGAGPGRVGPEPAASSGCTGFVRLARRYPNATLVFTGGSGNPLDQTHREADAAGPVLEEMGIPKARLELERNSRNTHENAVLTRKLLGDRAKGRWILVTSAWHMPRAMGAFRKAGWDVVAYPVDYRTHRAHRWITFQAPQRALGSLGRALHEWAGLTWYHLMGRSDSLFPGPKG